MEGNIHKLHMMTGQELLDKKFPTQYKWGKWTFKNNLTLVHDDADHYEIDLEKMSTFEALDWVIQIGYKSWCSKEDLADFVYALDDIYYVQSQLNAKGLHELYKIRKDYLERSKNAN